MKRIALLAILLFAVTLAAAPTPVKGYDFEQAWRYLLQAARQENAELRAENAELAIRAADAERVPVLVAEVAHLQAELDEANVIVQQVNGYTNLQEDMANLNGQIAAASAELSSIYPQISTVQTQLQALRVERDALASSMGTFTATPARLAQQYPGRTFWADKIVCSGSMVPWITCADLNIMLAYPAPEEIYVGDPIVAKFRSWDNCVDWNPGSYMMHRVVAIDSEGRYVTSGDANGGWIDPCPIEHADVIAKALDPIENFWPERWGTEFNNNETWRDNQ